MAYENIWQTTTMKKLLPLLFFFLPFTAFADVSFDVENHYYGGSGSSFSHTFDFSGASSGDFLVCGLGSGDSGHDVYATAVTWDGVSMTQLGTHQSGGVNGSYGLWVLPSAHNVSGLLSMTFSGDTSSYGTGVNCAMYAGADSSAIPTEYTVNSSYSTYTVSHTSTVDGAMLSLVSNAGGSAYTGTTQRQASIGWTGDNGSAVPAGNITIGEVVGPFVASYGAVLISPVGGVAPTSTVPTTTVQQVDNANQDFANGMFLFCIGFFGIIYIFSRKK